MGIWRVIGSARLHNLATRQICALGSSICLAAPPDSATRLRDFMNQANVFGLAKRLNSSRPPTTFISRSRSAG
eukprot:808404-Pelagomonas_calceolata.AAC.1